ncbi:RHS repeat-associated core domain-containing protein [Lysobacter sp. CFH 32150]|uniref:RHS repeat domain-containing protein n=1 Tax=Lysobacter sp. CFH 32150 TaxID=2927128 RepID=UPI001FA7E4EC|nr:RHS repeat-associated core domain-containing protein [Lysobacter sp. CFH 32150]MCI4567113.1 RHS repeat protein [Lysobacter sp. CFH 32150]
MKFMVRGAGALLVCAVLVAPAWGQVTIPEEYGKTIKSAEAVGALGPNLFGDQTSFYTGATTFSATDVSLPGNSSLPVAVGRRFVVQSRDMEAVNNLMSADGMFADWELDIPHLHAVFSTAAYDSNGGWQVRNGQGDPNLRCSAGGLREPLVATGSFGGLWEASEYWHGYNAYIPGVGDQEMLSVGTSNPHQPTDGKTYEWVTNNQWYFSCLPNTANGVPGEAFLAISPDGTRYWFDWFASREASTIVKEKGPVQALSESGESTTSTTDATSSDQVTTMAPVGDKTSLTRMEVWILPTRVEDRFGNYVTYTYDATHPWRLTTIAANDGRQLTLGYNTDGDIASVSDDTRTWIYRYSSGLSEVELPDTSKWLINFGTVRQAYTSPQPNQNIVAFCEQPSSGATQPIYTGTITHPSGAVGEFRFQSKLHGRSYVPKVCIKPDPYGAADYAHNPFYFDTVGLIQKTISGPGLPVAQWSYTYGPPNNSWAEDCTSGCVATKTVEVTGPGDFVRYTFGNKYRDTDGKLLKVETGSALTSILKTETTTYLLDPTNQAYPSQVGRSPYLRGDHSAEKLTPSIQRQITQQGTTFTWQANQTNGVYSFDQFANPLSVTRASSLGYTQTNVTEYEHNTSKWVLGQVKKLTTDGIEVSRTDYHAITALPTASYSFNKLQHSAAYYTDGTLRQLTDGRNYTTTFSVWNRGIPELIQYPATPDQPTGASVSAHANPLGWIEWAEDENGYRTCYGYDAMGRLANITHPSETAPVENDVCDTSKWAQTTRTFAPVLTSEYGIAGGHWKQIVSTGNARKVSYFDAMWRPLVTESYDSADAANTRSVSVTRYDAGGHPVFQSYPLRSLTDYATVTQGSRTTYDSLDRVTRVEQDSELGVLASTTEYLTGFQTRVTNPRGHATTTSYYVYDQPTQDLPRVMLLPEGARTTVYRDVFGKPTTLVRGNADSSVWNGRYYVYDANQQLCKRVELETGTTAMGYDAAGNLAWSAAGLPWSNTTDCTIDTTGRRADRTYDARNRLKTLSFPDGVGNQVWTYTPDSKPDQITTYNATNNGVPVINAYHYNRRRLLDGQGESISQPEWYTWGLGYGYDGNGNLASHVYPNNVTVDYAPNALGQPTKAGTYATGVSYHPNGAIAQFTYGNGIVHTLAQNTRQLPDRSKDAYGGTSTLDDSYDFDENGNVAAISDGLAGAWGNRTMTYDGLDRLKTTTTTSPMFGSEGASYEYDVLDNLTRVHVGGTAARDHYYCYDAAWRLTNVKTTSCSGASVIGLGYDLQGNLDNKNGQNYDFDFGNRLRIVTGKEHYRYDGHGRRALAWAPGYANGNILSQYDMGGVLRYQQDSRKSKQYAHFYLGGSLVATRETPIGTNNHVVKYQHTDALGSPVAVTDASRVVLERSEYEPYGKVLNRPVHDGPGYTGHVEDAATGLTYMQQRYYDPGIGRFLSVDPVTADGNTGGNFNRYWYANNNPYRFKDPDGRCSTGWGFLPCPIPVSMRDPAMVRADQIRGHDGRMVMGFVGGSAALGAAPAVAVETGAATGLANLANKAATAAEGMLVKARDTVLTKTAEAGKVVATKVGEAAQAVAARVSNVVTNVLTNPAVTSFLGSEVRMEQASDVATETVEGLTGVESPAATPQGLAAGAFAEEIRDRLDEN